MLIRGYLDAISEIIKYIDLNTQFAIFSRTMPREILALTKFCREDVVKIDIREEEGTLCGVRQYYVNLQEDWKLEVLLNLYKVMEISQAIIFCNSKESVNLVTDGLNKQGFIVSASHPDMSTEERAKSIKEFRYGTSRAIVVSGNRYMQMFLGDVPLKINFDIPEKIENYVLRVGAIGTRSRPKSLVINFVTLEDKEMFIKLQNYYDTFIEELPSDLSMI